MSEASGFFAKPRQVFVCLRQEARRAAASAVCWRCAGDQQGSVGQRHVAGLIGGKLSVCRQNMLSEGRRVCSDTPRAVLLFSPAVAGQVVTHAVRAAETLLTRVVVLGIAWTETTLSGVAAARAVS